MSGRRVLAIDIGGTKLETVIVAAEGRILAGTRQRRPTGRDCTPDRLSADLLDAIEASISASDEPITGAGIGSAGPVDLECGAIAPHNMPLLNGVGVVDLVRQATGAPTSLRLDGSCLALAEHWLGAARGSSASMSIVVSTGVGGGIVVDGRLLAGRSGNAGHIGQIHVAVDDRRGSQGTTLEAVAAGPSAVLWARDRGWHGTTGEELAAAVASGDSVADAATRRSAWFVGQAVASAATLLDLDRVVIGGGFVRVRPDYLDLVRDSASRNAVFDYAKRVDIRSSGLGDGGPLLGAAALQLLPQV